MEHPQDRAKYTIAVITIFSILVLGGLLYFGQSTVGHAFTNLEIEELSVVGSECSEGDRPRSLFPAANGIPGSRVYCEQGVWKLSVASRCTEDEQCGVGPCEEVNSDFSICKIARDQICPSQMRVYCMQGTECINVGERFPRCIGDEVEVIGIQLECDGEGREEVSEEDGRELICRNNYWRYKLGDSCSSNVDCEGGYCDKVAGNVCKVRQGLECESSQQCQSGNECVDNVCSKESDLCIREKLFEVGGLGSSSNQFNLPGFIDVDSNQNIYVSDIRNNRVQKFNSQGFFLRSFEFDSAKSGSFERIAGIDVTGDGNIYVADMGSNKVFVFDSKGSLVRSISEGMSTPIGVAVNSLGNVYVSQRGSHRVSVYSNKGQSLLSFGGQGTKQGQFGGLGGIYIDSKDDVYVVDSGNHKIQVFDKSGKYKFKFGIEGDSLASFGNPFDIAVGKEIYVTDQGQNKIKVFDLVGNFIDEIQVEDNVEFGTVSGIAVSSDKVHFVNTQLNNFVVLNSCINPRGEFVIDSKTLSRPGASCPNDGQRLQSQTDGRLFICENWFLVLGVDESGCSEDSQCSSDLVCSTGFCRINVGDDCSSNQDSCAYTSECVDNVCVREELGLNGKGCSVNDDCSGDLICSRTICKRDFGASCADNVKSCAYNLECRDGSCLEPVEEEEVEQVEQVVSGSGLPGVERLGNNDPGGIREAVSGSVNRRNIVDIIAGRGSVSDLRSLLAMSRNRDSIPGDFDVVGNDCDGDSDFDEDDVLLSSRKILLPFTYANQEVCVNEQS